MQSGMGQNGLIIQKMERKRYDLLNVVLYHEFIAAKKFFPSAHLLKCYSIAASIDVHG